MPWTATVSLDTDKATSGKGNVGTVTCTFDDGAGYVFVHTERGSNTVAGRNGIVANAKAALLAAQTMAASEATLADSLTAALNK